MYCACATLLGANVTPPTHVVELKFLLALPYDCGKREKMDREQLLLLEEAAVNVLVSYLAKKGVGEIGMGYSFNFWMSFCSLSVPTFSCIK